MIRLFSLPARRHAHNAVSAQVAIMESRTLLSGNAIFPQPASVKPQAATPADFSGQWNMTVQDEPVFTGLNLTQDGTDVSGTYRIDDGSVVDYPFTNGTVAKKKLTIEVDDGFFQFTLQVKLKGQDAFKGKLINPAGTKFKATGSRVTES